MWVAARFLAATHPFKQNMFPTKKLAYTKSCLMMLLGLLACLSFVSTNTQAASVSIPYDRVYQDTAKLQSTLKDFNLLSTDVKFSSGLCGVGPNNITLYIRTREGMDIPLPLNRYGFTNTPLGKELYQTGARIVSNQPSDLKYQAKIVVIPPANSRVSYAWVTGVLRQATSALKEVSSLPSFFMPDVTGIALIYNKPGASVTLTAPGKDIVLNSQSAHGFIGLPENTWIIKLYRDKSLGNANPTVELHDLPDKIEPLFDPDIEAALNKKIIKNDQDCNPAPA